MVLIPVPAPCCEQSSATNGKPSVLVAQLFDGPAPTTAQFVEERTTLRNLLDNTCACYQDDVIYQHMLLSSAEYDNRHHLRELCIDELLELFDCTC